MKINAWIISGIAAFMMACGNNGGISHVNSLSSMEDSLSYALGMDIGNSIKTGILDNGLALTEGVVAQGLMDVLQDNSQLLDQGAVQPLIMQIQQSLQSAQQEKMMQQAETNQAEGDTFFQENKGKEGVIETESGLQYKIIESGDAGGKSPAAEETVVVHYTGRLLDGTVFDSSVERGAPATFRVNQVISGWTEALQLMVPGDKWELYIPSNLGYGAMGSPPDIGPYASLVFEVELLEIQ